jgi:hypothetical protein
MEMGETDGRAEERAEQGGRRRIVGEYAPPREVVALEAARLSGRGMLEVGPAGLAFDGALQGVESRIPSWAWLAVLAVAAAGSVVIPDGEQVLMPGAVLVVGVLMWLRFRSDVGVAGVHSVPWSQVEHVVRLPSSPDTLAFVLTGPVAGHGSPEQVYFAPTAGIEDLVDALRSAGPASLTIDTASAEEADPAPADDESEDEDQ